MTLTPLASPKQLWALNREGLLQLHGTVPPITVADADKAIKASIASRGVREAVERPTLGN